MKKCLFCGHEIQDEAIKCKYCKEWLDNFASVSDYIGQKNGEKEKNEVPIENHFIDSIVFHLEFLGYQIDKMPGWFKCQHERKKTFIFSNYYGGILLSTCLQLNEYAKDNQADLLLYINQLNQKTIVSRISIDENGTINFCAWFPGHYDKKQFGLFIDLWDYDTAEILAMVETALAFCLEEAL